MNPDVGNDPVLAAIKSLRAYDLTASRTHRLRVRCHRVLKATERKRTEASSDEPGWPSRIAPLLLGVWCVMYVMETVRLAMRIYGS